MNNDIAYSEIYHYINSGTLDEYLDKDNNRFDIHYNGTRPIATWTFGLNTPDEKMVDICLDVRDDGKPQFFERLQFTDDTIEIFETYEEAFVRMLSDIEKQKSGIYEW